MKARHLREMLLALRLPLLLAALVSLWPLTLALWMLAMGFVFVRFCLVPPLVRALRTRRRGTP